MGQTVLVAQREASLATRPQSSSRTTLTALRPVYSKTAPWVVWCNQISSRGEGFLFEHSVDRCMLGYHLSNFVPGLGFSFLFFLFFIQGKSGHAFAPNTICTGKYDFNGTAVHVSLRACVKSMFLSCYSAFISSQFSLHSLTQCTVYLLCVFVCTVCLHQKGMDGCCFLIVLYWAANVFVYWPPMKCVITHTCLVCFFFASLDDCCDSTCVVGLLILDK